jgi:16S rRNA processing protein RimM
MDSGFIELGRVVGVHGLAGEVVTRTTGDSPEGIGRYSTLFWRPVRGAERRLEVESCRVHRGKALLRIAGVGSREEALALVGGGLGVPREMLQPAGDGRHYVADMVGLAVETTDGRRVGTVREVMETGANDVYVVDADGREILVPAVDHVVRQVDVAGGRIVIEAIEGLLD